MRRKTAYILAAVFVTLAGLIPLTVEATAIDIGSDATDRGSYASLSTYGTAAVDRNNPANASGTLDTCEIYAGSTISRDVSFGTFAESPAGSFTPHGLTVVGSVAGGSKQTFTGLTLTVTSGDYLGVWVVGGSTQGNIQRDTSGGGGTWKRQVSGWTPEIGTAAEYTELESDGILSIYGTGTTSSPPNAGSDDSMCLDASDIDLTTVGATPAGGTWSGTGVSAGVFHPHTAGAGAHELTYTVGAEHDHATYTVYALPTADAGSDDSMCLDASDIDLTTVGATPAGGTWSGTGVSAGVFHPHTAGAGAHELTYTVTNENDCSDQDTATYTVYALPNVTAGSDDTILITADSITLVGNPSGGTWTGDGVTGGVFDPAAAGLGPHTLTYSYTGEHCSNTDSTIYTVVPEGTPGLIDAGPDFRFYMEAPNFDMTDTGESPLGGTWSGDGVTGSIFSPTEAGLGEHIITYTLDGDTDYRACTVDREVSLFMMDQSLLVLLISIGSLFALLIISLFRGSILVYLAGAVAGLATMFVIPDDMPILVFIPVLLVGYFLVRLVQGIRQ